MSRRQPSIQQITKLDIDTSVEFEIPPDCEDFNLFVRLLNPFGQTNIDYELQGTRYSGNFWYSLANISSLETVPLSCENVHLSIKGGRVDRVRLVRNSVGPAPMSVSDMALFSYS